MNRSIHASDRIILAKLVLTVLKSSDGEAWPCHSNCDHEWQKMPSLCQWRPIFQVCRIQTLLSVVLWHSRGRKFRCLLCLNLPWLWHSKMQEGLDILGLYREKKGVTRVWNQPCDLASGTELPWAPNIVIPQLWQGAQPVWVRGVTLEKVIWCVPISSLLPWGNLWIWEEWPGNSAGVKKNKTAVIKNQESCHGPNPIPGYSNISLPHPLLQIMLSIKEAFFSPKQNTIFLKKALNLMN